MWQLTDEADRFFPNGHADLVVNFMQALSQTFGSEGFDKFLQALAKRKIKEYRSALPKGASLADRVKALAKLRTNEGYMAEVRAQEDGSLTLIENHCPICAAATECQKFCRSELEIFQQVLGPNATVERSPNRYYLDAWLEHATELDPWKATPMTIGSPVLGYRSIRKEHGHPTVQTDSQGGFRFEQVKIGEYVLTVEADGYAPQSRNIKAGPESGSQQFDLKSGRKVQGRVVDDIGQPVPGACVVLNLWHVHKYHKETYHILNLLFQLSYHPLHIFEMNLNQLRHFRFDQLLNFCL